MFEWMCNRQIDCVTTWEFLNPGHSLVINILISFRCYLHMQCEKIRERKKIKRISILVVPVNRWNLCAALHHLLFLKNTWTIMLWYFQQFYQSFYNLEIYFYLKIWTEIKALNACKWKWLSQLGGITSCSFKHAAVHSTTQFSFIVLTHLFIWRLYTTIGKPCETENYVNENEGNSEVVSLKTSCYGSGSERDCKSESFYFFSFTYLSVCKSISAIKESWFAVYSYLPKNGSGIKFQFKKIWTNLKCQF